MPGSSCEAVTPAVSAALLPPPPDEEVRVHDEPDEEDRRHDRGAHVAGGRQADQRAVHPHQPGQDQRAHQGREPAQHDEGDDRAHGGGLQLWRCRMTSMRRFSSRPLRRRVRAHRVGVRAALAGDARRLRRQRQFRGQLPVAQRVRDLRLRDDLAQFLGTQQRHRGDGHRARLDDGEPARREHRVVGRAQQHALAGDEAHLVDEHVRDGVDAALQLGVAPAHARCADAVALAPAARDGNHWILDGEKTWISNGGIADFYVVFAREVDATSAVGARAKTT